MFFDNSATIIGAGSYGTALAVVLSRNNNIVSLWGYNPSHIRRISVLRSNQSCLPNIVFPPTLYPEESLKKALLNSRNVFIVVPSYAFNETLKQIKPLLRRDSRVIWATKGLEPGTGRLLKSVAQEILGYEIPLAVISGPVFADELAVGLPSTITISTTDTHFSSDLRQLLYCSKKVYINNNSDLVGVQLSGVVKNIIAIIIGISDGIGFGSSAKAVLITNGLKEMSCLGVKMGANKDTFTETTGLGDLILTCTDNKSRNRRFGLLLGTGLKVKQAKVKIGHVIEGYNNIREVLILSKRYEVNMPIVNQMYQILYNNENVYRSVLTLLDNA